MIDFNSKFSKFLPKMASNVHKYTRGRIAIVAGSVEYPGAAMLASRAAARAGAGYVNLFVEKEIMGLCQASLPSIIVKPLCDDAYLDIEKANCIVAGPGLGVGDDRLDILKKLIKIEKPLIIDADLIKLMPELIDDNLCKERLAPIALTPHRGELKSILENEKNLKALKIDKNLNDCPLDEIASLCQKWIGQSVSHNTAIVAKGTKSVVVKSDEFYEPSCGTDALATAGSGDVLAGIIGGIVAQSSFDGLSNDDRLERIAKSCAAAVEVHALSGILSSKKFGRRGSMACDIADCAGLAIDELYSATK